MIKKSLSLIIPVFNEEGSIEKLVNEINLVLEKNDLSDYEIIIVNDGSNDKTWDIIGEICKKDKNITGVNLRKNFGKSVALNIGFSKAEKDYVITLDADLQDDPREIPRFIEALDKYDFISGWKKVRNDPITKTIPSKIFNYFTKIISGVKLNDFNCGFKGYKKEVVKNLNLYGELHRYIPLLVNDYGFKISEIQVNHRPRLHGKSKFGFERYYRGLIDLITVTATTTFFRRPGHLFGGFGLGTGIVGSLMLLYLFIVWILNNIFGFSLGAIGSRPLLFLGILLLIVSIQLISIGIMSELFLKTKKPISTQSYILEVKNEKKNF